MEVEFEKTYLLEKIPEEIDSCDNEEITDIYLPSTAEHPILRIRKRDQNYEIIKKTPINEKDSSEQEEQIIILSQEEFKALTRNTEGKTLKKKRYYLPAKGRTAEVDLFAEKLKGLGLVDFEFDSREEKKNFEKPDFCLAEVTQEKFIAGGMLAGKKYSDIKGKLKQYSYKKLNY